MKINYEKFLNLKTVIVLITVLFFVYFFGFGSKMTIQNEDDIISDYNIQSQKTNDKENEPDLFASNITGEKCLSEKDKRPVAVMLAADKVARPLSGISSADIVFEMPVITDGITRYMAVFLCEEPKEIGSIRSARVDFITLAKSMDAIFVHWGGSSFALDELKKGVIDNIDALLNPYDTFFRKKYVRPPHNGFTSYEKIKNAATKLKFRQTNNFVGFLHEDGKSQTNQRYDINIGYPYPYNVKFRYSPERNSYFRFVGGFKEVDRNTNKQVEVKNLVVLKAISLQKQGQYNDVQIENSGDAIVYKNGEIIPARWEKKDRYYFYDENKKEIPFTKGKIWISIVQPNQPITIKNVQ